MICVRRPAESTKPVNRASRPASGPQRQTFSVRIRAARPTMAATFITPTVIRITIGAQQQPRQYPP